MKKTMGSFLLFFYFILYTTVRGRIKVADFLASISINCSKNEVKDIRIENLNGNSMVFLMISVDNNNITDIFPSLHDMSNTEVNAEMKKRIDNYLSEFNESYSTVEPYLYVTGFNQGTSGSTISVDVFFSIKNKGQVYVYTSLPKQITIY